MPEADNINTPHLELPPLRQLEAEGEAAAREIARALVRETLRSGGRIDLARLERAGPSVQAAYQRILAQVATKALALPKPAPAGEGAVEGRDENGAVEAATPPPEGARDAGGAVGDQVTLPRVEKGWRDRCGPVSSFEAAARHRGLLAGAIVTVAALAAVALFHL